MHVVLVFVYFCFSFGDRAKEWIWVTGFENVFLKKYEELMCFFSLSKVVIDLTFSWAQNGIVENTCMMHLLFVWVWKKI